MVLSFTKFGDFRKTFSSFNFGIEFWICLIIQDFKVRNSNASNVTLVLSYLEPPSILPINHQISQAPIFEC